jgi:GH35 family endo-1,4-beta-xylanase
MKSISYISKILLCYSFLFLNSTSNIYAQLGKCKGKYFGNIIQNSAGNKYNTYWNQVTSENGSKWGSVESSQGNYSWTTSDASYNWAKNNGGIFKYHNFVWGQQAPSWVDNANTTVAAIQAGVQNYIKACSTHYTPMGGLKMIDVVNEPVNTAFSANYKAALTAGYKAEPANAGDLNNQYGWVIWPFQLARKYFPDATLLINEYNIEHNWNNCRTPYMAMVNAVKNAPNLTDGKKNLIDGVGLQCHSVDGITPASFKACIDEIWNTTGVAIHITEFDVEATPNEAAQTKIFSDLIPVAWEHPHVAGITFWGYIQGTTWRNGNGTAGPNGTDTGLLYSGSYSSNPYGERPAMVWLKNYISGKADLTCCPAPAPFAACTNGMSPTVSISSPANNASFAVGANIAISAIAADADGTVTKVEFYNGTTKIGEDLTAPTPFTFTWTSVAEGFYTLTAVATDNSGNKTTSADVNIVVGNPSTELLSNGEFDNSTTGWTLQNNSTGVGTMSVVTTAAQSGTNTLKLCPTTPGTADWHVQVQQPVPVVLGKSYEISFMAKADAARTMTVGEQQNSSPYRMYYSSSVSLTTTNQTFTYSFTADTTDAGAVFKFLVGNISTCVYIDKVSMKQVGVITGIDEVSESFNSNVFPNPFTSEFQIVTNGQFAYRISNQLGQLIEVGTGENSAIIGSQLSKGLYILSIENSVGKKTQKIVKE